MTAIADKCNDQFVHDQAFDLHFEREERLFATARANLFVPSPREFRCCSQRGETTAKKYLWHILPVTSRVLGRQHRDFLGFLVEQTIRLARCPRKIACVMHFGGFQWPTRDGRAKLQPTPFRSTTPLQSCNSPNSGTVFERLPECDCRRARISGEISFTIRLSAGGNISALGPGS